jgi:hypothetical protein
MHEEGAVQKGRSEWFRAVVLMRTGISAVAVLLHSGKFMA